MMQVLTQQNSILVLLIIYSARNVFGQDEFPSDCIASTQTQFVFVNQELTFDEAIIACEARDATLARVEFVEEHEAIVGLLRSQLPVENVYIGLKRNQSLEAILGEDDDPRIFEFIEGPQNKTFYEQREQIPWENDQPNVESGDNCAQYSDTTFLWQADSCDNARPFLCSFSCAEEVDQNEYENDDLGEQEYEFIFLLA